MKKYHIARLEKLYAFLGTVKPEKFYFGEWALSKDGKPDVGLHACGTTACALGWAASMPAFRKRGLKLEWIKYGLNYEKSEARVTLCYQDGSYFDNIDAGYEFFGLTSDDAEYLFLPEGFGLDSGRDSNSIGPEDMSVKEYRRGLRKFINKKKRELKVA